MFFQSVVAGVGKHEDLLDLMTTESNLLTDNPALTDEVQDLWERWEGTSVVNSQPVNLHYVEV